jgi:hypothetical protein
MEEKVENEKPLQSHASMALNADAEICTCMKKKRTTKVKCDSSGA